MFSEIKLYLYGAIATILIATGLWWTIHERHEAVQQLQARDLVINTQRADLATAATQHNKDVLALAQALSDRIGDTFEQAVAAPVTAPPHLLCYRPTAAPVGGDLPKAAGNQPGDSGATVERGETPFDIGPAVVTVGKDADAQINALIDEIKVLTDEMNGKSK